MLPSSRGGSVVSSNYVSRTLDTRSGIPTTCKTQTTFDPTGVFVMPPFSFHQSQLRMHSKIGPLAGDSRDLALACDWPTLSARPCVLRCKSWPHAALPGCGWPRIILELGSSAEGTCNCSSETALIDDHVGPACGCVSGLPSMYASMCLSVTSSLQLWSAGRARLLAGAVLACVSVPRLSVRYKRLFISVSACETVCVEPIACVLHRVGRRVLPLAHTRSRVLVAVAITS